MVFVPYRQETNYTCGATSMRMALEKLGIERSEKQLARMLHTNKIIGTWHKDFSRVSEKYKLDYVVERKTTVRDLKKYQKDGYTIIVCYFCPYRKVDHYSVLKKIDSTFIYFYDPWWGPKHKYRLTYFNRIWGSRQEHDKEKRWFFAVKKP